jgi:hypothetical protein
VPPLLLPLLPEPLLLPPLPDPLAPAPPVLPLEPLPLEPLPLVLPELPEPPPWLLSPRGLQSGPLVPGGHDPTLDPVDGAVCWAWTLVAPIAASPMTKAITEMALTIALGMYHPFRSCLS